MCTQRRLRSALASAKSDQSLPSAWRKLGSLATNSAHSEDWSDGADAQADPSLCWVHRSFCWFWHKAAQILENMPRCTVTTSCFCFARKLLCILGASNAVFSNTVSLFITEDLTRVTILISNLCNRDFISFNVECHGWYYDVTCQ